MAATTAPPTARAEITAVAAERGWTAKWSGPTGAHYLHTIGSATFELFVQYTVTGAVSYAADMTGQALSRPRRASALWVLRHR